MPLPVPTEDDLGFIPEAAYLPVPGLGDLMQKGAQALYNPAPPTSWTPPSTFRNTKDAEAKFSALRSTAEASLPQYYTELSYPLRTNRLGGIEYSLFPGTNTHNLAGPGSLLIYAHGWPDQTISGGNPYHEPGSHLRRGVFDRIASELRTHRYYIENAPRMSPREKSTLLSKISEVESILPGTSDAVPISSMVHALGQKTNDIRQIINGACYASGITPTQWRTMFPNLTNVIQSDTLKPTTIGSSMRLAQPLPDYTNAPDTSPLINYDFVPKYNAFVETKPVMTPLDWNPIK